MINSDNCPKCGGKRNPEDIECRFCGIIFSKYKKKVENTLPVVSLSEEEKIVQLGDSGPSSRLKNFSILVIAMCVAGLLFFFLVNRLNPEKKRKRVISKFSKSNQIDIPGVYKSNPFIKRGVCSDGCSFEMVIDENFNITSMAFDRRNEHRTRSHILWEHPSYVVATQTLYDSDSNKPPLYESQVIFDDKSINAHSNRNFGDCIRDNIEISYINEGIEPLPVETGRLYLDSSTQSLRATFRYFIPDALGIKISRDQFDPECVTVENLCKESFAKNMGNQWESIAVGENGTCSFDISIWPLLADFRIRPVSFFESIKSDKKKSRITIGESSEFFLNVHLLNLLGLEIFFRKDGSVFVEIDSGTIEQELFKVE